MRSIMHLSLKITTPCRAVLLLLVMLSADCPWAAVAQGTASQDATPATTTGSSSPANSPNLTNEEVQLMPTLPLQTATANLTRPPPASTTASSQQQQTAAAPIPAGDRSSSGGDAGGVVPDPEATKTDTGLQQAEQQVQGPAVTNAQQGSDDGMPLINFPGCTTRGGSPFLSPGLFTCEVQGLLNRRQQDAFSFSIAPATDGTRPYRLLIMMRTVDGDAQLGLSIPKNGVTDPVPDQVGTQVYATEITSEVVIEVPWGILSGNPGRYTVSISQAHSRTLYTLRVFTPFDDVLLVEPDLSVMKDLYQACCKAGNATSTFCTDYLPSAIAPNHSPDDDMCRMTPMMCDDNGHLTQLAVAQAGLQCAAGLPDSFAQLEFLQTLDLAFNDINMDIKDMGKIIAQLPALQNAFMRYTGLTGQLPGDCDLIRSLNLTRMSLSGNNITGNLPDCYLQDETLQELYLSQTGLTGPVPDVVPPGSPLRLLFAINYIQKERVGFTGPLPGSLLSSPAMTYLDLGNNKFTGDLPPLGNNLKLLNLSMNALDGTISGGALPASLESLDLAFNQLQGTLPPGIDQLANLTLLNVQDNRLSGSLPQVLPEFLLVFDASGNQFTGSPPPTLPAALHYFNAADNQLSGTLPAIPSPSLLLSYNLYGNGGLTGTLPLSLINGSAPALLFIDVHGNQLSGRLDGSSGSSGVRKLLQEAGGAMWAAYGLGYLDLSNNTFTGPVPASLGNLTDLVILNLSGNQLSGSLEPFADTLVNSGQDDQERPDLLWLDVSDNQLTGPIPDSLQYAPMMDPSRVGTLARRGQLLPRVLDLSGNYFTGPFPSWIASQSAQVARACGQLCDIDVGLNGTNMKLSCPADLATTPDQLPFLKNQDYQCTDASGNQVSLLTAVNADGTGQPSASGSPASSTTNPAELNDLNSPAYTGHKAAAATSAAPQQGHSTLSPGAIAGIVIGAVAGAAVIAGAAFFGVRKYRHHHAGWRKDDFGHDGVMGSALGVARGPSLQPNGSGAASNGLGAGFGSIGSVGSVRSVRFQDGVVAGSADTAFKDAQHSGSAEYPHTPYENAQAGIEMLSSRKDQE